MTFDFQSLEPRIREILSAPGIDLSTISAKRVRQRLSELDSSLSQDFLKEHKAEVDGIISHVYTSVSEGLVGSASEGEGSSESAKRKHEEDGSDEYEEIPAQKGRAAKKAKREVDDDEGSGGVAARSRKGGRGSRANGASKKAGKSRKSAKTVESGQESEEDEEDGKKTRRKKKAAAAGGASGSARGGFAKEYTLSVPLADLLGVEKLSRPQVVKHIWTYIKGNGLQNPENGKEILCDDRLKAVFGVERIDMFKMNKVLGNHLSKE
ncbi:hypothetical protein AMATHDRAFT_57448 [Amanita thiersii Skay4041]|uniref:Uncharacterized protein n=1 Tax=Amanita thiersii Skay4041 TaxID=703135 RepID=A0A2A9NWM4_9AGAR|nr:hypothetical protein AMATHDRAFT_57448 [Amanita thiersii Skay4041]